MIFKAKNGAEIVEKIYPDEDEAIKRITNLNHALVIVKNLVERVLANNRGKKARQG